MKKQNVVIFDKPYGMDKQAEGIAIADAVATGKCNICGHLPQCENDSDFKIPKSAPCMVKKRAILQKWGVRNG